MINVQCPLIVEHWTFCILHSISPVQPRCPDARSKNRQQFLAFSHHHAQLLFRTKLHLAHELQPRASFTQLLEADPELVDEVASRFGSLHLAVVRERRGGAAGDLRADVLGDRGRRKAIRQQADLHGKIDEPIFEVVARPRHGRLTLRYRQARPTPYAQRPPYLSTELASACWMRKSASTRSRKPSLTSRSAAARTAAA